MSLLSRTQTSFRKNKSKKMKPTDLQDFYSVFINAVEKNPDNIVNKKECIQKIIQLKIDRENANKKSKFNIDSLLSKERPKIKNKVLQFMDQEKKNNETEEKKKEK